MKNMFKKLEAEAFQEKLDKLMGSSAAHSAMKIPNAATSFQEKIDKLMGSSATLSAWKSMSAVNSYQERLDKLMGSSAALSAWKSMSAVNSYQERLDKLMSSSAALSAWKSMSAVNSYQERLDKLMGSSAALSAWKSMSAVNSYQNTVNKLVGSSSFQNAVDAFTKQPDLWEKLDWLAYSDEKITTHELQDSDLDDAHTERQLQLIGEASDSNSFTIAVSNLPPKIKYIFIVFFFFLLSRAIAIADNIAANIITPHVEKLINDPSTTERKKVKQLKSLSLDELDLSNLRFITTAHLLLRESPNTKSEIKGELRFGQVVTMLGKQRNWMEVYYDDEDGTILQGWVFSRYTEKFAPNTLKRKPLTINGSGGLVDGLNPLSNKSLLDAADDDS